MIKCVQARCTRAKVRKNPNLQAIRRKNSFFSWHIVPVRAESGQWLGGVVVSLWCLRRQQDYDDDTAIASPTITANPRVFKTTSMSEVGRGARWRRTKGQAWNCGTEGAAKAEMCLHKLCWVATEEKPQSGLIVKSRNWQFYDSTVQRFDK